VSDQPSDNPGRRGDKRLARKLRDVAESKHMTGETAAPSRRLPPGQHTTVKWPVLDLGEHPNVPQREWKMSIAGLVARPGTLDWDGFRALPQSEFVSDIHCVTAWSRFDNHWAGVSTRDFLDWVSPLPEAKFVILRSFDGYATNLPLEHFAASDALLAHSWEGEPLSREHGGPVRLIVPRLYFWKSAKWLRHVLFTDQDVPGYWEVRGYHSIGDPWKEERYG